MTTIDRSRLGSLLERERAEFVARNPRSHTAYKSSEHLFGRVPMTWMNKAAAGFPVVPGARARRAGDRHRRARVRRPVPGRHRRDGRSLAGADRRGGAAAVRRARRRERDAADRGRGMGRRRADPPVRHGCLELLADGDRRQPLGASARAGGHRPTQDPRQQLLLPRQRRRVADRRRAGRSRREPARATSGRRRRSRRPAGSPSTTTWPASSASWPPATSQPC